MMKQLKLSELLSIYEDEQTKKRYKKENFDLIEFKTCENTNLIRFNSPRTLNRMSLEFQKELFNVLMNVYSQNKINILIGEPSNKNFCVGADLMSFYKNKEDPNKFLEFGHLSNYIFIKVSEVFSKNTLTIWNGVSMGGGLAISIYAQYRVATETSVLAMPESKFGFFTNCFYNNFISKILTKNEAIHMAIFSHKFESYEVYLKNFANYFILNKYTQNVITEIEAKAGESVHIILTKFHEKSILEYSEKDKFEKRIKNFDKLIAHLYNFEYDKANFFDFYEHLKFNLMEYDKELLNELLMRSLMSIMYNFKIAISAYENLTFEAKYELDSTASFSLVESGNMMEGIRAFFVDKDKKPRWTAKF